MKIKTKIFCAFLIFPLLSFAVITGWSLIGMLEVSRIGLEATRFLGFTAVEESKLALCRQSREDLAGLVFIQSVITERQFAVLAADVENIASLCADMLKNPEIADNPVLRPFADVAVGEYAEKFSFFPASVINIMPPSVKADIKMFSAIYDCAGFFGVMTRQNQTFTLVSASGVVFGSDPKEIGIKADPRRQVWYKQALASPGKVVFAGPFFMDSRNEWVIACSKSIKSPDGKTAAVVMIDISAAEISKYFTATDGTDGYAFILGSRGKLIAFEDRHSKELYWDIAAEKQVYDELKLIEKNILNSGGIQKYTMKENVFYAAAASIPNIGWNIGIVLPEKDILASALKTQQEMEKDTVGYGVRLAGYIRGKILIYLLFGLSMGGAAAWLAVRLSGKVNRHFDLLREGAAGIGAGKLETRITLHTGDELQRLGEAFNRTAVDLAGHIENLEKTIAARELMEKELAVASGIQSAMLSRNFSLMPEQHGVDFFARAATAREMGGDFYDFFFITPDKLYFCIGGIYGKGVAAALLMARIKTLLRVEAMRSCRPEDILRNTDGGLSRIRRENMPAAVLCGIMDIVSGEIDYSNAGGDSPAVITAAGTVSFLEIDKTLPLGSGGIRRNSHYTQRRIGLSRDQFFIAFTGGVVRMENREHKTFAEERLLPVLSGITGGNSSEEAGKAVLAAAAIFLDGAAQKNDMTVLAVKYTGKK